MTDSHDPAKTQEPPAKIQEGIIMALSTTLDKTRKDVEKTLSDPTPLYALAGAGDLAAEKLRAVSTEIAERALAFDAKAFRDQAQAKVGQAQATVAARVGALPSDVKGAPEAAKALPAKAQAKAADLVTDVVTSAITTYGDLAGRGKTLVTRVRKQQATTDLDAQVDATVSKVKAATTTVKKSAKATTTSAKSTRTTAKKSAAKSKTAVKAATTSAKKTAVAAKGAVEATAEKIGD